MNTTANKIIMNPEAAEGMLPGAQRSVEEEHALLGPARKVYPGHSAYIVPYFFEDVAQRWRNARSMLHGETQSVCLPGSVIRVLTNDHYANIVWCSELQCSKHVVFGGKNIK